MKLHYYIPQPRFSAFACFPNALGHYYAESQHAVVRPEGLPCYNLHLIYSGKGYIYLEGKKYTLHKGTGFLYGKAVKQEYWSDELEPWDIFWTHFEAQTVVDALQSMLRGNVWLFAFSRYDRAVALSQELVHKGQYYKAEEEVKIAAILYELVMELLCHSRPVDLPLTPNKYEAIWRVTDYIKEHCEEPLDLADMAAIAGYSLYHFSRLFHQITGKTPSQFLLECRIISAKQLLTCTDLSISDISYKVGFNQCSYFIRKFREYENITPEKFRKTYQF